MDAKLLLVKVITLLFRESQIPDKTENSADLVKQIIATLKLPEAVLDTDKGRETLVALRATAIWMANNSVQHEYDRAELLQRIRVNIGDDSHLYEALIEGFEEIQDIDRIKKNCLHNSEELKAFIKQNQVKDIIRKASHKVLFDEENVDWSSFVGDTITELEPYTSIKDEVASGEIDGVDFSDINSISKMIQLATEEISSGGILKTGIQAINRMLGDHDGFLRGESWVIGALQHNFKSGFLMSILRGFVQYNTPRMLDPKKKPLILFITLENSISQNILWLYANFKEHETGEFCDIRNISVEEAATYLKAKFEENGFTVKMRRFNPTEFTYRDLFNVLLKYEAEGFEIHALLIDYLNMMNKAGCVKDTTGGDVRDLFRRVRNYTNPRGITFITPHQLSSDAKNLVRQNIDNFVKQIANQGYYDSCKLIDQEVDGELYIHIEKKGGRSYLTVQRGKHRKAGKITPEEDLYTVLPFLDVGAINDDVGKTDLSMKKLTGGSDFEW